MPMTIVITIIVLVVVALAVITTTSKSVINVGDASINLQDQSGCSLWKIAACASNSNGESVTHPSIPGCTVTCDGSSSSNEASTVTTSFPNPFDLEDPDNEGFPVF